MSSIFFTSAPLIPHAVAASGSMAPALPFSFLIKRCLRKSGKFLAGFLNGRRLPDTMVNRLTRSLEVALRDRASAFLVGC